MRDENAKGHKNVRFLDFPTQRASDGFGADWHPSVKTGQSMADKLAVEHQTDLGRAPVGRSAGP